MIITQHIGIVNIIHFTFGARYAKIKKNPRDKMSYADKIFVDNIKEILTHGYSDEALDVRPHWADGTPAHTVKKFGIVNRYPLIGEFPILTLRRTYLKSAIDEILWIWQKKSNNVHDLHSRIWDAWAEDRKSVV